MRRCFLLATLACALPVLAFAGKTTTWVFTSFDPPGSTITANPVVNNAGEITGSFSPGGGFLQGFVFSMDLF